MIQKTNQFQIPENLSDKPIIPCRVFSPVCFFLLIWLSPNGSASQNRAIRIPGNGRLPTTNQKLFGNNVIAVAYKNGKGGL